MLPLPYIGEKMVKIRKGLRLTRRGWEIRVDGISHGHCGSLIEAQRAAVDKINSMIHELEDDRKRFTDEILKANITVEAH